MGVEKPNVIILKTGSTYPQIQSQFGDFDAWFIEGLSKNLALTVVDVVNAPPPSAPDDWAAIVVTGSPAMVSDRAPWSETTAQWIRQAVASGIPLLGVCYGHQLLAHALGGKADYHPQGRETGTHTISLLGEAASDPLFSRLPSEFQAHLTHKQSVLELPEGAVLLARSAFEPHQAFRVGDNAWGVQFHPEFSDKVMKAYLEVQYPELADEGLDAERLMQGVCPAPEASHLLTLFSEYVTDRFRNR
ncbi:glutamine amidotransferase [Marinobacter daepoensis]|uniref:Glutamine amidotransferase n=1 Tax=Marinobacter daepoensis TaxID=262077 RepID=A0ABS3BJ12_9GAMM|nr:glutamine amidotransferase [Marinobacter daepoensis]MBN7771325.1 glutamine amidotransferase [Marinobacter daepoensis]MBY6079926.1 glutamine amidotransferase [Marinobacter daepoensis]